MRDRNSRVAVLCVLVLAVGAAYVAFQANRPAAADDASHTTSLGSANFPFDGAGESSVRATFTSTDSSDVSMKITMYVTPSGTSTESKWSISETVRGTSDPVTVEGAIPQSELSSGDTVRAHFEAFDSSASSTFSYSRTYTLP